MAKPDTDQQHNQFTEIVIIYNPISTGPGEKMAKDLQQSLREAMPNQLITLTKTEHAGHAEMIAYTASKASQRPLIISASGDGGYHEVVNGIIKAQQEGAKPVAGLLPAGNANDHFHNIYDKDIVSSIENFKLQQVDLLKLSSTVKGTPFVRYAHSYIGFGLTPKVGKVLNSTTLHWYNEIIIVIRALLSLHSIKIMQNGKRQAYYSLICSNVVRMSKVLVIGKDSDHNDGAYEVNVIKRHNKIQLIKSLIHASTRGTSATSRTEPYSFTTIKPLLVQLDGEISTIDANSEVTVSLAPHLLTCLV